MASIVQRTVATDRVAEIIQLLRRRWRMRHALVGLGLVAGMTVAALWIAAVAMERAGFSEGSITFARIAVGIIVAVIGLRWIAYPLLRRVPDSRVALYAEERLPALDGALMSAVEATSDAAPDQVRRSQLISGLVQDAVRRLRPHRDGASVEDAGLRRAGIVLASVIALGAAIFVFGPSYLRHGLALIATPWKSAAEVAPYSIAVRPGNANVPKGGDQQVSAELHGFRSDLVEVVARRGASAAWERIPMGGSADSTQFSARLFDVATDVEYYVESNGIRSGVFRLTVRNLPAVRRVDLDLRYPAYTGLAPEHIDGGDIAALIGTRVRVSVRATLPVRGGRLVLEGDSSVALQRTDDSTLAGALVVRRDGFYRIDLEAIDGTRVAGSVDYVIDALEDQPPSVTIRKPGRDTRPTNVEEVFVEVEATDDFGVGKMELLYSVNGGAEKTVVLNDSSAPRSKDVIAGHTFFLEELSLQAGDVVSYYARAKDAGAGGAAKETATDIYFLTVRPFGRDYRQNQQGGGGGGGGGANPGALTQQQRDIVAATFKTERDRAKTPTSTFRENVTTILLSEGKLRQQVEQLAQRMNRPVVQQSDTGFRVISELLTKASGEMKSAEEALGLRDTKAALSPEQLALRHLEHAEAVYRDVQVSMGGGGGGGGGGGQASAEELADLFELENDKLRNQYEQVQRGQQQTANAEVDETLERLKQLAARQQQEIERARQRGAPNQAGGGSGGGGSQRQLADEAENMARQLERLAREQNSTELAESARRLQEAANQMRRSASSPGNSGGAAGSAALDRIENARRLLEQGRASTQTRGVQEAAQRAAELARQQREVAQDVGELANAGAARGEREQRLDDRKQQMATDVQRLQDDLEQMGRDMRRERPQTARQVQEAAARMRDERLRDKIQFSRGVMRQGTRDYARNFEGQIQEDLDSLSTRLGRAAGAAGAEGQRNANATLDQARDLVRGLASIDDRMRARESGAQGGREPGQRGLSPNEQRQQASGQQGQGQQGQGQQGQGQQGQGREGQGGGGQQPGQGGLARGGQQQGGRTAIGGGGGPGAVTGPYNGEDIRQYARELRNQREAAEGLRRELQRDGRDVTDLSRLIDQLRQLESQRAFDDPEELAQLRSSVVQGFKEFEFTLRRHLAGADAERPVLGGNEDVPQGYRDLVNEYFKALSKKPPPKK